MTIHAEVLPTYRRFRQLGLRLSNTLVKTLSKETLHEGGRRLGIFQDGKLVFDHEDQLSVLMDYCIHNIWVDGQNAIQRYREQSPPPSGSDEMVILTAMLEGYYSLIEVINTEPGVGLTVRDHLRGDTHFLADIGMSQTANPGIVFATRLFSVEEAGFLMTGGAGLPVTAPVFIGIKKELDRRFGREMDFSRLTPDQEADLAAAVIRNCLESGMGSRIAYGASAETSSRMVKGIDRRTARLGNPNDACPCGSGRKLKSCCGRRPRR
jgi:SEC-C motif